MTKPLKTFRVFIEYETEVNAEDEEEAIAIMQDNLAVQNESIENFIKAEEVK